MALTDDPEIEVETPEPESEEDHPGQTQPAPESQTAAKPKYSDEERQQYGKKVQRRLNEMTAQVYAERQAREQAERRARMLEEKLNNATNVGMEFYEQTLTEKVEAAERDYIRAAEAGDAAGQAKAQRALAEATANLTQTRNMRPTPQPQAQAQQSPQYQPQPAPQQQPQYAPKTAAWMAENSWFGKDQDMTATAQAYATTLERRGINPESDDYWGRINRHMKQEFPDHFVDDDAPSAQQPASAPAQRQSAVAPVTRSSAAPQARQVIRVKPTEEDRRGAEITGVSLEKYLAAKVAVQQRNKGA